jgi:hypothetical protein
LTTPEADEQGNTRPIEPPAHQPAPEPQLADTEETPSVGSHSAEPTQALKVSPPVDAPPVPVDGAPRTVRPVSPLERETVYVPLAVNIGDGFKFGCGFFLAMVLALLVGFVVLAGLFVLTGLFGLNLPLGR